LARNQGRSACAGPHRSEPSQPARSGVTPSLKRGAACSSRFTRSPLAAPRLTRGL
jgi:hypothetical protein